LCWRWEVGWSADAWQCVWPWVDGEAGAEERDRAEGRARMRFQRVLELTQGLRKGSRVPMQRARAVIWKGNFRCCCISQQACWLQGCTRCARAEVVYGECASHCRRGRRGFALASTSSSSTSAPTASSSTTGPPGITCCSQWGEIAIALSRTGMWGVKERRSTVVVLR
jgi:hypothetical protein